MPLPITAFALSTPYGVDAESTLDALAPPAEATTESRSAKQLLDQMAPFVSESTDRWGRRRLAAVVGGSDGATATDLLALSRAAGCRGPALAQVGGCEAGARALATAARWISHGVADAVLVGAGSTGAPLEQASAWLHLERHGASEFALCCPAAKPAEHQWDLGSSDESMTRLRAVAALAYVIAAGLVVRDGRALPGAEDASTDIDSLEWAFGGVSFSLEACDP